MARYSDPELGFAAPSVSVRMRRMISHPCAALSPRARRM
jgi:hypothetical protein